MAARGNIPNLAVTQGDAAGVGPEILLKLAHSSAVGYRPLYVAERAALEQAMRFVPGGEELRLHYLSSAPSRSDLLSLEEGVLAVLDPVATSRRIEFGVSGAADAAGALACLDQGIELALNGVVDGLVTAPVSKFSIADHCLPSFRGHTDYVAEKCGLECYGRDYLMTFLAPDLQVALLTTHIPLRDVFDAIDADAVVDALRCLYRQVSGKTAVAALNPHAGEGGLMGCEEEEILVPAIERARAEGLSVHGPESADSLFARARQGEFDWVLALYHDQGLTPVKAVAFGSAANWTLGLPFVRTSVDHGTAFDHAGKGQADSRPLKKVIELTCELLSGRLPRSRAAVS